MSLVCGIDKNDSCKLNTEGQLHQKSLFEVSLTLLKKIESLKLLKATKVNAHAKLEKKIAIYTFLYHKATEMYLKTHCISKL